MKPFADASFVVSFCARDEHGGKAWRWWRKANCIMMVSRLVLLEAENAIRVLPLTSQKFTREEVKESLETLKRAILEGFFEIREVPVRRLYPAAQRLSQTHSTCAHFGAMDILHVASAMELGCDLLLSFDKKQRELAQAEGLAVMP